MKYHFHRDTILATIFLFVVLWLLSVTIHTSILEPGKIELPDFDHTDVVYSQAEPNKTRFDQHIVIVNVGDTDRAGIAAILNKVNTLHPAAVGLDLVFHHARYPDQDSMLAAAISASPNLVLCSELNEEGENQKGIFALHAAHSGYGNFYGENRNAIRYCKPFYKEDTSFAAAILQLADPKAFETLYSKDHEALAINYTRRDTEYMVIDYKPLLNGLVDDQALKGKVVLVGLYSHSPYNIEDKHLTPMNPVFIGRSLPDMHGVVIHANILSMTIDHNYITRAHKWVNYLLAVLLGWLCTGIFIKYLVNKHIWFHIIVKLWQSAAIFLLFSLNILLFKYAHVKMDLTLPIVVLIFSAEILYLYEIFAIWMGKRFNHKTIFKQH